MSYRIVGGEMTTQGKHILVTGGHLATFYCACTEAAILELTIKILTSPLD